MSYARDLCFLRIVVSNTYRVVCFYLFIYVLCTISCHFFLDCPFLITPSVFSKAYLLTM